MNFQKTLIVASALISSSHALGDVADIFAGDTIALSGITHEQDPSLGGVVAIDYSQDFELGDPAGDLVRGTLQSRVSVRHDTGELDFSWRIRDVSSQFQQISSIVLSGFEGWDVGVEWRIDGSGDIGASHALRTADDNSIGFLFESPFLVPPAESKFVFARTHASTYELIGTARINLIGGEFVVLDTWAPTVPTPGGLALLGISGIIAGRRRRA